MNEPLADVPMKPLTRDLFILLGTRSEHPSYPSRATHMPWHPRLSNGKQISKFLSRNNCRVRHSCLGCEYLGIDLGR